MNQKRIILNLLNNRKRIDITCKNYLINIRIILISLFLAVILLNVLVQYYNEVSIVSLALSAINILFFGLIFRKIHNSTSATSIKGDTLILNNAKKKHYVTSIRSIQKVKTASFLGIQMTRLYYNLDGVNRRLFFLTRCSSCSFTPAHLVQKAIKLSKKQKANHKPGPVSA